MKKEFGTMTFLFAALAVMARAQDQGIDRVTRESPPVFDSSVVERVANACDQVWPLIVPSVKGQLDSSACELGSGIKQYVDFWVFSGDAGQSVTVSYASAALSPLFATIQDYDKSTVLASDSGDSPVVFSCVLPTTGLYRVGLSSLKGVYSTGPYTLLVSYSPGGGSGVNLTPYTPSGWSGPVVVSTVTNTHVDASAIQDTDEVFVDYAIFNSLSDSAAVSFVNGLYLDGDLVRRGPVQDGVSSDYHDYLQDYSLGRLTSGLHVLRLIADAGDAVHESSETDNGYVKIFVVQPSSESQACTATASNLCLNANRFKVEASWRTSTSQGSGMAIPLTADSGYFWFFDPHNVELIVKVLDACSFDSHRWVFAAGLTNVEVTITVTDTKTGVVRTYSNPSNTLFQTVADTATFSTCP